VSQPDRDSGFTLIEVLTTVVLMGVVMSFAVLGFSRYSAAYEQKGTARSLQSALRQVQQRAVTEGRAMCVEFASTTYTVWRTACDPSTGRKVEGPTATESAQVHLEVTPGQTLAFTPRGTATWSTISSDPADASCGGVKAFHVLVTREGSTKSYRLCVAALTGRVDLDG
jgi:prepilin-type N-terminal cleavage/methylation domain-containing protein